MPALHAFADTCNTYASICLNFACTSAGRTADMLALHRMFCQATGFGGTVQQGSTVEAKLRAREAVRDEALEAAAAARDVTVSFNANVIDGLPWRFSPTQRSVTIKPGQSTLAFYTAHNTGNRDITGTCLQCSSSALLLLVY